MPGRLRLWGLVVLTELYGKAGRVCQPAREGQLRCPLIVRPTSEDVITGYLCSTLRTLNPRWWLPDLLNTALGSQRFRRQVFRRLVIEPWQNQRPYPSDLLPWSEGSTQVDLTLRWENPPTTVFIEMKYFAQPSASVSSDNGGHGFPSDQIIRNIRVGLQDAGRFQPGRMFQRRPRDFVFILLVATAGERLIHRYRSSREVMRAIPHSERLIGLPRTPFVGELTFRDVGQILQNQLTRYTRPEREVVGMLIDYLHKKQAKSAGPSSRQRALPGLEQERGQKEFTDF